MARVQFLEKADLRSGHQHIYDEIDMSRGGVQRNFKALLNSPTICSDGQVLERNTQCLT